MQKIWLVLLLGLGLSGCAHEIDQTANEATRSHADSAHQELDRQQ